MIADSGSQDRTHKILVELQKELSQLEILTDTQKQHGPKVIALYDYAIKNNADYIFQTDSDGQTDPGEFDAFWEIRRDYNLPNIMLTTYFAYYKEKIVFKTISFKPRQGGKNSINIGNIVKIGWGALRDFHLLKKEM